MAQCKLTPQEFIQNAFSPMIAVLETPGVDETCKKNNLSFIELLQPFCKLNVEAQIRDPTGTVVPLRNLRITLQDVNYQPPQPALARKILNSSVNLNSDVKTTTVYINNLELDIPSSLPWFESWRDTFLHVQYPSDHEFTKHFLACMIVISSNEKNPLESLNEILKHLTQLQTCRQTKLPKWFSSNVLRYYVVLHDTLDGKNDNAIKTLENLKLVYGINNCFLLQINSRRIGVNDDQILPDPWSQFLLKKTDHQQIVEKESPRSSIEMIPDAVPSRFAGEFKHLEPKFEIGQEASESSNLDVNCHPLSPESEMRFHLSAVEDSLSESTSQISGNQQNLVHGSCLTTDDIEQLKSLVHDFCVKALLPYVEKQIQQMTDMISNKKGMSRSLFSATKRWFTPNKPGSSGSPNTNAITYAIDSPDLQLRKLADLYFLFGHYNLAFQMYHSAKRDFNADQAWLYYAGALEMAAVSAFLCGEVTRKTCDYMEESITTYLYTCRMPQFATRATLLSTECLKGKKQYAEVAAQFIRMTSEDSDLRSALLLEQAAYCYLNCNKSGMLRKYAFHIILAGHRFSKCFQRKHTLRCYRQAFQVYMKKGWNLADDHIYFTIGRQAYNLNLLNEATETFSKLLMSTSKQSIQQQELFLREYLTAHQALIDAQEQSNKGLPVLHIPQLDKDATKVMFGSQASFSNCTNVSGVLYSAVENDQLIHKWDKLEKLMVQQLLKKNPSVSNTLITHMGKGMEYTNRIAAIKEPVQVAITLHNTLDITLNLRNVFLLWEFIPNNRKEDIIKNEVIDISHTNKDMETQCLNTVVLAPGSKEEIILTIKPMTEGELTIYGVCYTMTITNIQNEKIQVTGKQIFSNSEAKNEEDLKEPCYQNTKLKVYVASTAPCMQVNFSHIRNEVLSNELQKITIEFKNCGSTSLHNIAMSSSVLPMFACSTYEKLVSETIDQNEFLKFTDAGKQIRTILLPENFQGELKPGQSHSVELILRAPKAKGNILMDLLFYYENVNPEYIPRYRVTRHSWNLIVEESVQTLVNVQPNMNYNDMKSLTLSVRTTNNKNVYHSAKCEMRLMKICLLSKKWKLSSKFIFPKDKTLLPQESLYFVSRVYRYATTDHLCFLTEVNLSDAKNLKENIKLPCIDFAHKYFLNEFETGENFMEEHMKLLDMLLILVWEAVVTDSAGNIRTAIGQEHIPVWILPRHVANLTEKPLNTFEKYICEELTTKPEAPMPALQKHLYCTIKYPSVLHHNFEINRICLIPISLMLYNDAQNDIIVKVSTLENTRGEENSNHQKGELFIQKSSSYFRWIGHNEFFCYLTAFGCHQVKMVAAICVPGTYNLSGRIEIYYRSLNQFYELLNICYKSQSSLVIKQRDN